MKNIEFYYDELYKLRNHEKMIEFAKKKGMEMWDVTTYMQDFLQWLNEEHREEHQILNAQEKEYLSAVIKPFRKNIKHIIKCSKDYISFIKILMVDDDNITLPYFNEEDMYLGMKPNEGYTLEELGL